MLTKEDPNFIKPTYGVFFTFVSNFNENKKKRKVLSWVSKFRKVKPLKIDKIKHNQSMDQVKNNLNIPDFVLTTQP